jgi:hypothetical protein
MPRSFGTHVRRKQPSILPSYLDIIACVACLSRSPSFPAIAHCSLWELPVCISRCKSSVRCRIVGGSVWPYESQSVLKYFALAERKSREGCGWRERVLFSQQLRTAARMIRGSSLCVEAGAEVKNLLGVSRKERVGRRFRA